MTFGLGVVLFALGIAVSIMLHEAGHLLTAKRFGMKATQYFVGFGPTLFSWRRGETEYGLKAIPAGGFVKIVGMTPLEDVEEADDRRAFWRYPTWKRTVVLSAGSLTHFVLALVLLYVCAAFVGIPTARAVVGEVTPCVVPTYEVDTTGALRDCQPGDPAGPARAAGLREGDRVVRLGDRPIETYEEFVTAVREAGAGPTSVTYVRDGERRTATVNLVTAERPTLEALRAADDATDLASLPREQVGAIGIGPSATETVGPVAAIGTTVDFTGRLVEQTFIALSKFPEKVPKLVSAIAGEERDPETPISVVGASRAGGQALEAQSPTAFLLLLAGLNMFIGVFNLFPLLPLDGGHIAIAWYERVRSWAAARLGRPDPGRVDYTKLLPLTYVVVVLFGGLSLLAITADIVNPVANPFQ